MYGKAIATESRIGENLVNKGLISESSVNVILLRQEFGDSRLFGQIATSLNFLSKAELSEFLKL